LLDDLERAGVTHLPRPKKTEKAVAAPPAPGPSRAADPAPAKPSAKSAVGTAAAPPPVAAKAAEPPKKAATAAPSDRTSRIVSLQVLAKEVAGCVRCPNLAATRTQTVFGVGNPQARLCFFGEAPGADEDAQGEPFVGRAGQLLTKIIEACTLRREDVYILNTLKCRPPGNRNPLPEEVTNCRGYYQQQLEIIRPEFICCLGAVAAQALLETESSIGKLRGQFFDYGPSQVLCTYHPAYLLRNPAAKKEVWADIQILMAKMGIPLPGQ
jgi:DNA polymerase